MTGWPVECTSTLSGNMKVQKNVSDNLIQRLFKVCAFKIDSTKDSEIHYCKE